MRMPPPIPTVHCCVCYPGNGGYPGSVCGEFGIGIKMEMSWEGLPTEGMWLLRGGGGSGGRCLGLLVFYMHTKSEVSIASDIPEMQGVSFVRQLSAVSQCGEQHSRSTQWSSSVVSPTARSQSLASLQYFQHCRSLFNKL